MHDEFELKLIYFQSCMILDHFSLLKSAQVEKMQTESALFLAHFYFRIESLISTF